MAVAMERRMAIGAEEEVALLVVVVHTTQDTYLFAGRPSNSQLGSSSTP